MVGMDHFDRFPFQKIADIGWRFRFPFSPLVRPRPDSLLKPKFRADVSLGGYAVWSTTHKAPTDSCANAHCQRDGRTFLRFTELRR